MSISRYKNKMQWPKGEWDSEPHSHQWVDGTTGYRCAIRRTPDIGILCGYVEIPHQFSDAQLYEINVHGGITYNEKFNPIERKESSLFWIGFDCGHWDDVFPSFNIEYLRDQTYKNFNWVIEETTLLAAQLKLLLQKGMTWNSFYKNGKIDIQSFKKFIREAKKAGEKKETILHREGEQGGNTCHS